MENIIISIIILTSLLSLSGAVIYARDIIKGSSVPHLVSFGIWTLAFAIALSADVKLRGLSWEILPIFIGVLSTGVIFTTGIFSKNKHWDITRFDYFCGAISVSALIAWIFFDEVLISLILAIITDFFAAIPSLKKYWTHPYSETLINYVFSFCSAASALLIIDNFKSVDVILPLYFVAIITTSTIILIARRRVLKK